MNGEDDEMVSKKTNEWWRWWNGQCERRMNGEGDEMVRQ